MALRDTLSALKQAEQKKTQWETEKPDVIKEWQNEVLSLSQQIRSFLQEFVDDKSLTISAEEKPVNEPELGNYTAVHLTITAGSAVIEIKPTGRMNMAGLGTVTMSRSSPKNEVTMTRLKGADGVVGWTIKLPGVQHVSPARSGVAGVRVTQPNAHQLFELSKQEFERGLDLLLNP